MAFASIAHAGTCNWTGGFSTSWSDSRNWSNTPSNGDDLNIGGGTTYAPTCDATTSVKSITITSTVTLTIPASVVLTARNGITVSTGTLTITGSGAASFGASEIKNTGAAIVGASNALTFTGTLLVDAGGALTNNGSIDCTSGGITAVGNPSPIINTGSITFESGTALTVNAGGSVNNTGTITTNSTCTVSLTGNPAPLNNNLGGYFTATSTAFTMAAGSSITNTGGTFGITSGTITCNGNPTNITNQNSGTTTGSFSISGATIAFKGTNLITNYGTFTANGGTTITTSSTANTCTIKNFGTFYAGTSNSACTITFALGSILKVLNTNTTLAGVPYYGNFYLGSTSIIYPTSSFSSIVNSASCTFTLQSDIYGSASIGALSGSISGNYNVERYLSGGSSNYRSYRALSSPVYETSETSASNTFNVFSINYIAAMAPTTGSAGTTGGFTQSGNPTFYLYRDNIAPSNSTFISGNFRGIANISTDPSYSVDVDGSTYLPVGNGFLFFDRGDKTGSKFVPGTSAESITLTATGTLNTGSITVTPWFAATSNKLDYTAVTGNSAILGLALVGNPYASSIDWDKRGTGINVTSVGKTIYILDPLSLNYDTYIAGNGGVGNYSNFANIIPSGQGFFVVASASGAQLTFTESAKTATQVSTTNSNLFLSTNPPPVAVVNPYLRLKLAKDSIHTDAILINFNSSAKPEYVFDEDATYKPGNGPVSLSSKSADNLALSINTLPLPKLSPTKIPLNVAANANGTYTISMESAKSIPDLYDVWLMDAYKKDSLDIKHNPTYIFDISTSDTTSFGQNRFSLVIREKPSLMVHLLNFTAEKIASTAQVVWKTENEQNYTYFTVERSTDNGQTFSVIGSVPSAALGSYSYLDKAPLQGANLYRLKIEDINGSVSYSNVVTIMYGASNTIAINGFNLYPNPTAGSLSLAITNQSATNAPVAAKPVYNIEIVNSIGAVVKTAQSSSLVWKSDVSQFLPGTYIVRVINSANNSLVGKSTFVKL